MRVWDEVVDTSVMPAVLACESILPAVLAAIAVQSQHCSYFTGLHRILPIVLLSEIRHQSPSNFGHFAEVCGFSRE